MAYGICASRPFQAEKKEAWREELFVDMGGQHARSFKYVFEDKRQDLDDPEPMCLRDCSSVMNGMTNFLRLQDACSSIWLVDRGAGVVGPESSVVALVCWYVYKSYRSLFNNTMYLSMYMCRLFKDECMIVYRGISRVYLHCPLNEPRD